MSAKIKVLLADDHTLVRQGLKAVLEIEDGIEIAGEASTGREAIEKSLSLNPDVILLDLRLPEIDGVAACLEIKKVRPEVKVIILTTFDDDEDVIGAMQAGASSYILKDVNPIDLIQAIHTVAKGKTVLDPGIAEKLVNPAPTQKPSRQSTLLSDRELEVLELMAEGLKNKDIADRLWISQTTVKTHVSHILQKLNQSDRTQAILTAIKLGIVDVAMKS